MVAAQADVNRPMPHGVAPLMVAAASGNQGVLEALLAGKADVTQTDALGRTPLMATAAQGNVALSAALLKAKADPDQTCKDPASGAEISARAMAERFGHVEVVSLLR